MLSRKVILTGSFGVGKTSLFSRFINNTFSDRYITTIGVKVDKKSLEIDGQEVSILLWDIACLLYTSPSPRDATLSRMPSSA